MWTLFRLTPQSHTTAQRNRFMLFSSFFLGGFVGIKMGWTQETCESSKDMFQLPNFPVAMANRVLGGWISTWQLVWHWMWWHLPSFRPGAVDAATSKPRRSWANLFEQPWVQFFCCLEVTGPKRAEFEPETVQGMFPHEYLFAIRGAIEIYSFDAARKMQWYIIQHIYI